MTKRHAPMGHAFNRSGYMFVAVILRGLVICMTAADTSAEEYSSVGQEDFNGLVFVTPAMAEAIDVGTRLRTIGRRTYGCRSENRS